MSQYDASPVIVSAGEESLCGIIKEIKADSTDSSLKSKSVHYN